MKTKLLLLLVLPVFFLSSCYTKEILSNNGKTEIEIKVVDKKTNKPISGVLVQAGSTKLYTDRNGCARFVDLKGDEQANVNVAYRNGSMTSTKGFPVRSRKGKLTRYTVKFNK